MLREAAMRDRGQNPQPALVSADRADRAHANPPHRDHSLPRARNDSALTAFDPGTLPDAVT